jgi:hypothetical protein
MIDKIQTGGINLTNQNSKRFSSTNANQTQINVFQNFTSNEIMKNNLQYSKKND